MRIKTLSSWAEQDQPIYKLMERGRSALSDAELLSMFISLTPETSLQIARELLLKANNDLHTLAKFSMSELTAVKGVTANVAVRIVSLFELTRRRREATTPQREKITSSRDADTILRPLLADLPHEEFWILFLNRGNFVMCKKKISQGGTAGTVVDPKLIFKSALDEGAASMILCHNHPSGNTKPSENDIKLTKNLVEAGKTLEIAVLDHVIIGNDYFSFADEGMM